MIDVQTITGRGLTVDLGFVAPATPANEHHPPSDDPDGALAQCLALLMQADQQMARLPDDHPSEAAIMAWMDTLLGQAAVLRPTTDRGFAVKARIARVYGDCAAGERVQVWLLSDLMTRGRA